MKAKTLTDEAVLFIKDLWERNREAALSLDELTRRCLGEASTISKQCVLRAIKRVQTREAWPYKELGTGLYFRPGPWQLSATRRKTAVMGAQSTGTHITTRRIAATIPEGRRIAEEVASAVTIRRVRLKEAPLVA